VVLVDVDPAAVLRVTVLEIVGRGSFSQLVGAKLSLFRHELFRQLAVITNGKKGAGDVAGIAF
jgi:hypothetical protein